MHKHHKFVNVSAIYISLMWSGKIFLGTLYTGSWKKTEQNNPKQYKTGTIY